jgi:hypothetical protein
VDESLHTIELLVATMTPNPVRLSTMGSTSANTTEPDRDPPDVRPRSLLLHVSLLLGLALTAAVGVGVVVWLGLGQPNLSAPPPPRPTPAGPSSTETGRPSLTTAERLDGLKIVLAVVGGVGAVVALTVAYRKQRHGEVAAHRDKRAEAREVTKAFTDRYGKAADQLGADTATVRLAGVYALAALADDWEAGRQMCIDLLCAYMRMPYDPDPTSDGYLAGNRELRRSLLRVIRNHLRPGWTAVSWGNCKFSFEGATIDCGDLSKIRLACDPSTPPDQRPNMTFHRAKFIAGTFELTLAELDGAPVWFTKAEFSGGTVKFDRVKFAGSHVRFGGARFSGANVTFESADWTAGEVTFDGAKHTGGDVAWGPFASLTLEPSCAPP